MGNTRIWLAILTVVVAAVAAFLIGRSVERSNWVSASYKWDDERSDLEKALAKSRESTAWAFDRGEQLKADMLKESDRFYSVFQDRDAAIRERDEAKQKLQFSTPGMNEMFGSFLKDFRDADFDMGVLIEGGTPSVREPAPNIRLKTILAEFSDKVTNHTAELNAATGKVRVPPSR